MNTPPDLTQLTPEQLRQLAMELMGRVEQQDQMIEQKDQFIEQRDETLKQRDLRIQQLTHEVALLKRHKYGQRSEHLNALQINRCPRSSRGPRSNMNRSMSTVRVGVSCAGSAKRSAKNWTIHRACSPSSGISVVNGSAMTARP